MIEIEFDNNVCLHKTKISDEKIVVESIFSYIKKEFIRIGDSENRNYFNQLIVLTSCFGEHPDWYDYPCMCESCQEY